MSAAATRALLGHVALSDMCGVVPGAGLAASCPLSGWLAIRPAEKQHALTR